MTVKEALALINSWRDESEPPVSVCSTWVRVANLDFVHSSLLLFGFKHDEDNEYYGWKHMLCDDRNVTIFASTHGKGHIYVAPVVDQLCNLPYRPDDDRRVYLPPR